MVTKRKGAVVSERGVGEVRKWEERGKRMRTLMHGSVGPPLLLLGKDAYFL